MGSAACANCDQWQNAYHGYYLSQPPGEDEADFLCSLSCLTEWVWKLRENEKKLSKSKETA